jgi:hypothetical protein
MTLPNERTRAVILAADFLTRLVSPFNKDGIKKIPRAVRKEALGILRHFPWPTDLQEAGKHAPHVFDAATVLQHYEQEEQKNGMDQRQGPPA